MEQKKIVVLGAGFGGLRASTRIAAGIQANRLKHEVVLIDRNEHHTYTPLLYEVATTSKETASNIKLHNLATYNIPSLIAQFPIEFIQGEVKDIQFDTGKIFLESRVIHADHLVIALGAESNFFNIPGLQEYSVPLKTFWDAVRIRERIVEAITQNDQVRILVGGGGPTGVELAGELKEWCGELKSDFPSCRLEVGILEGSPSILQGFDAKVVTAAHKRLHKLGVRIFENDRITELTQKEVVLKSGKRLPAEVFIWAGGVKASSVISKLPLKLDDRGRILVNQNMECSSDGSALKFGSRTYALGDAVAFIDPKTGKPVGGVARAAISQGNVAAHNILEELRHGDKMHYREYHPMRYPYVIPIGGKFALAKIGPLFLKGFPGWILKGLVELNYLASIMPLSKALKSWFKGLWVFIQNDRLG